MPQEFRNISVGSKPMDILESRSRLQKLINKQNPEDSSSGNTIPIRSKLIERHKMAPPVQDEVPADSNQELLTHEVLKNIPGEQVIQQEEVGPSPPPIQVEQQKVEELIEKLDVIEDITQTTNDKLNLEIPVLKGLRPDSGEYWSKLWDYHLKDVGKISNFKKKDEESLVLEVTLPKDNEVEIPAAEQMFAGLVGVGKKAGAVFESMVGMMPQVELFFKNPSHALSFELVADEKQIRFWVVIPSKFHDLVERQIHASYQSAQIEIADTHNFIQSDGFITMVALKFGGKSFYPIKSAEELGVDPINVITSAVSKLTIGQRAIIQFLIQPSDNVWRQQGQAFLRKTQSPPKDDKKPVHVDPKIVEAVSEKISRSGFRLVARIMVQSNDLAQGENLAENIARGFDQFSVPSLSVIRSSHVNIKAQTVESFITRTFPQWGNYPVVNTMEMASMFHFPNHTVDTPRIKWLRFRINPPPDNVATEGLYLGFSEFRANRTDIHLSREDRRRHLYVIGQTGTGKSEFLKSLAQQDIINGEGLAFIDPHGDAVLDLLEMIPKERAEDVIYFNPSDIERPPGLNILEAKTEEAKHMVVNSFIGLLYKLYAAETIGPQLERTVRNVMLTAMSEEGNTMIEVLKLIVDPKFIETKIHLIDDPLVKSYWVDQMASTTEHTRSEQLGYFVSKFDRFVTEKLMRNIIGQAKSAFNFREVMDKQKILLVNLSKGQLGEENSKFLGLLLVPRLLAAAMSRVDIPQDQRKDFYLYVDEFQNFATSDFVQILSEARKYRLCLTVANQFISQMQEDIRDAVFGNVGTAVSFRVGQDDAEYLEKQFEPEFKASDLVNLTMGQAVNRLLISGHPSRPFSFKSDWARIQGLSKNPKIAEIIKEISRLKYGRDRRIVESEINTRAGF